MVWVSRAVTRRRRWRQRRRSVAIHEQVGLMSGKLLSIDESHHVVEPVPHLVGHRDALVDELFPVGMPSRKLIVYHLYDIARCRFARQVQ